ncbi:uncharacterized protein LOC143369063 [Andrena cerasifolii]|uniref:uncharacterized protein LOC143369063 n=1 Tax=Andrena cerasifolii TaxID=2819439 RepID=UPI004037A248
MHVHPEARRDRRHACYSGGYCDQARRLEREVCWGDGEDGSVNDTVARANAPEVMFTAQSGGGAKEEEAARTSPITSKAATLHHGRQFLPLGGSLDREDEERGKFWGRYGKKITTKGARYEESYPSTVW